MASCGQFQRERERKDSRTHTRYGNPEKAPGQAGHHGFPSLAEVTS